MIDEITKTILAWLGAVFVLGLLISGVLYWVDQFGRIPVTPTPGVVLNGREYRYPEFPPPPPLKTTTARNGHPTTD